MWYSTRCNQEMVTDVINGQIWTVSLIVKEDYGQVPHNTKHRVLELVRFVIIS